MEPTPEIFALEIITYIGLAVSILGLLFTIITYLVVKYVNACNIIIITILWFSVTIINFYSLYVS